MKELADCEELDSMLRYQVSEMQRNEGDLSRQLEQMKKENNDLVQPQFKKITDEIQNLKEETVKQTAALEMERKKKQEFITRIEVQKITH